MTRIVTEIPALSADAILSSVLNTVYLVAGVVAVIVIIIAGYMYVTSNGDSAVVVKAKNAITYAVVGLVFIVLAFAITWFVVGRFV
jgi:hypothetical protein